MSVRFPPASPGAEAQAFEAPLRVVVVGANGSGKSRLGIWLEQKNQSTFPVHRISAQKALSIPDFAQVRNLEQAEKELFWGRSDQHASAARKTADRWGGQPATHLLSDYDKLLALLFAKEAERDRRHTEETRRSGVYVAVPDSPIDQIVAIWTYLMPQRSISFSDGKVLVSKGTPGEYHAKEMSDGERVALYLIGQCLCAPTGSMVIVDEPELHLHRSLMDKLWNCVEELCPDKSIVYITHDLEFAAGRSNALKIWAKSFSGTAWEWAVIPTDEFLPEALILEVIGSRKPVLFCEGDRGGLDHVIYQSCFPDIHVVPRGGAEKVVEAAKALRSNMALHSLQARGIVDRDVRTGEEVAALECSGIAVLDYAEIENVLCTEEVVSEVARQLALDQAKVIAEVSEFVRAALQAELDAQVTAHAGRRIRCHLSRYSPSSSSEPGLKEGVSNLLASLDVEAIARTSRQLYVDALTSGRLNALLGIYNRKSMADRISSCFGLKNGEYIALIKRVLAGPGAEVLRSSIRRNLPAL